MQFVNFVRVLFRWPEDRRPCSLPNSRDKPLPFKNFDPGSPPDRDLDSLSRRDLQDAAILKPKQKRAR